MVDHEDEGKDESENQDRLDTQSSNQPEDATRSEDFVTEDDPRVRPYLRAMAEADPVPDNADALEKAKAGLAEADKALVTAREDLEQAQRAVKLASDKRHAAFNRAAALGELPQPSAAEQLRPGEETELMFFPHAVTLRDSSKEGHFPAGINPVPKSLTTHWWLSSQGVKFFRGTLPASASTPQSKRAPSRNTGDHESE